jgi:phosphoserine phosphatase RsbU/P
MADDAAITDPGRLAAVAASGLLDTPAEEPFDRLARLAATVLETPYAFVTVVDDRRSFWKSSVAIGAAEPGVRQNTVEESFCRYVVGSGKALLVGETTVDPQTRDNPSNTTMGVRAWAGYPVHDPSGQVLGTFCVVDTRPRTWDERDAEVLATLAAAAEGEIALRVRAADATALARTLQQTLLPPDLPDVHGVDLVAHYTAAGGGHGLVGDFYDLFESVDGHWRLLLGDVCGHGVEAAKVASMARWSVRATTTRGIPPADSLAELHEVLVRRPDATERYLTAQLADIVVGAGTLEVTLAGAGHPPALVRRADGTVTEAGLGGQPIGIVDDALVASETFALGPGDLLVVYSDGLTEARQGTRCLGEDGVRSLLADAGTCPTTVVETLVAAAVRAAGGELDDDLALVALGPAAAEAS